MCVLFSREELIKNVDAVLLNCPLYPGTEGFFNKKLIDSMRRGSYMYVSRPLGLPLT
jgi:lactate dehydrogenase-like 2-hydroxyacid dehydrogenase